MGGSFKLEYVACCNLGFISAVAWCHFRFKSTAAWCNFGFEFIGHSVKVWVQLRGFRRPVSNPIYCRLAEVQKRDNERLQRSMLE